MNTPGHDLIAELVNWWPAVCWNCSQFFAGDKLAFDLSENAGAASHTGHNTDDWKFGWLRTLQEEVPNCDLGYISNLLIFVSWSLQRSKSTHPLRLWLCRENSTRLVLSMQAYGCAWRWIVSCITGIYTVGPMMMMVVTYEVVTAMTSTSW